MKLIWSIATYATLAILMPLSATAQEYNAAHGRMVVDFLENNQCRASYDRILNGLSRKISDLDDWYLDEILMNIGLDGSIGVNEDRDIVTYYSADCGNLADAELPRFIAAMASNGCTMAEADAEVLLPKAGFVEEQVGFLVEMLVEAGRAELSDRRRALTILPPYCVPA